MVHINTHTAGQLDEHYRLVGEMIGSEGGNVIVESGASFTWSFPVTNLVSFLMAGKGGEERSFCHPSFLCSFVGKVVRGHRR